MSMKLSYRDKVIVVVAIVLAIIIAGIFLFIKPKYSDLQASDQRVAAKEQELQQAQDKAGTLEMLKDQLKSDIDEVDELQNHFVSEKDYGETYQISQYLAQVLEDTDLEITGIDMDLLSGTEILPYTYQKYAAAYQLKLDADINNELPPEVEYTLNNSWPSSEPSEIIGATTVSVQYRCSADNDLAELFAAFDAVADHEKTIYMNTCSAEAASTESLSEGSVTSYIEGDLTITVYELYPMDTDSVK